MKAQEVAKATLHQQYRSNLYPAINDRLDLGQGMFRNL
jgi:hypothetical protein